MADKTLFDSADPGRVPEWVQAFLVYLKTERDSSPHTLVNYEIDLRHWLKFLFQSGKSGTEVERMLDLNLLREFLSVELERYERSTVNRRLSVIKGFLKFLYREGMIEKNLSRLLTLPRPHEKLPLVLKPEQIVQLIEGIVPNTVRHKRTRALIELLYSTGIRISELAGLTHEKVDFRGGCILVKGKGSKERLVPMGRHCQKALRDYIQALPPVLKSDPKAPLFLNQEGESLSVRTMQRNIREFAVEILGGVGSKVSPHTFRHSCATHLLAGGAGLREIQELLGHRSLVTTQKYTQVDVERLKRSYRLAHPKERQQKKKDLDAI